MSETNRMDSAEIRFNAGDSIWLKDGATDWENLGEIVSGKLVRKSDEAKVTLMRGAVVKKRGARESDLTIILAQTNKTLQDRIDALIDKTVIMVVDNGLNNGKHQVYYIKAVTIVDEFEIEFKGATHQALGIKANILPQSAVVECTPNTDLPATLGNTSAVKVTGTNTLYCLVEWTPA